MSNTQITYAYGLGYLASKLTEIKLPNVAQTLYYIIYGSKVEELEIPTSVTTIGSYGAYNNYLKTLKMLPTTPPSLTSTSAIASSVTRIEIPQGTLEAYSTATNWSSLASKFVEV